MPAHRASFRVYYEDTDAGGVMYHARYLAFAERGRSEALRSYGISAMSLLEQHGIVLVVRRLTADYLRPLRLDALVEVETALLELRSASIRLRQTLSPSDEQGTGRPAAVLDLMLAAIRIADMRPVRLPEPWAGVMAGLLPEHVPEAN